MQKKIEIILLVLLMIVIAFVRENFFLTTNALLNSTLEPEKIPSFFSFLENISVEKLVLVKWIATFFFILIFAVITYFIGRKIFPEYNILMAVVISFGGIVFLSFLSILTGWLIEEWKNPAYYFARWLTGSAQSPLFPSILLIVIFYTKK